MAGTSDQVRETAENVRDRLSDAGAQLRERSSEAVDTLRGAGSEARRVAQEQMGHFRDTASEYLDQGRERAKQLSENMESQIIEMPFRSVLIAAGVGFVLGALWMRR